VSKYTGMAEGRSGGGGSGVWKNGGFGFGFSRRREKLLTKFAKEGKEGR